MSDSVRPHRRQPTRLPHPWDSPGKNTGVGCHCLLQCMKVKSQSEVAQSCPTLSDPMDCSLPGSSVHGIFQTRVLEWGAIAFVVSLTSMYIFFKTTWASLQFYDSGVSFSRTRASFLWKRIKWCPISQVLSKSGGPTLPGAFPPVIKIRQVYFSLAKGS